MPYEIIVGVQPWVGGAADTTSGARTGAGRPYAQPGGGRQPIRPTPRPGGSRTSGGSGSVNPDQVAPLPEPPAPREGVTPVTITWYLVLDRTEEGGDA